MPSSERTRLGGFRELARAGCDGTYRNSSWRVGGQNGQRKTKKEGGRRMNNGAARGTFQIGWAAGGMCEDKRRGWMRQLCKSGPGEKFPTPNCDVSNSKFGLAGEPSSRDCGSRGAPVGPGAETPSLVGPPCLARFAARLPQILLPTTSPRREGSWARSVPLRPMLRGPLLRRLTRNVPTMAQQRKAPTEPLLIVMGSTGTGKSDVGVSPRADAPKRPTNIG